MIRKPSGAKFKVFHRNWWKRNSAYPNGLEPNIGRKVLIGYAFTAEEARRMCEHWCDNHRPGKLSNKAEFESL